MDPSLGKTTLVNYILKEQHGKKICVIENEFGAVNIDESLVKVRALSMSFGCAMARLRGLILPRSCWAVVDHRRTASWPSKVLGYWVCSLWCEQPPRKEA